MGKSVMEVIAETKEKHLRSFIREGGTPSQFEEFWKTQEGEVSRNALRLLETEESSQQEKGPGEPPMDRAPSQMSNKEKIDFVKTYGEDAFLELCVHHTNGH